MTDYIRNGQKFEFWYITGAMIIEVFNKNRVMIGKWVVKEKK
jgi:hypothetical protein